jgi:stage V sporulation protein R
VSRLLTADLRRLRDRVREAAVDMGLDFFETSFELLDPDEMHEVAAYGGFPTRYPHWRFGMEWERLRKGHAYGLHRIYELVINADPCTAYLLRSNAPVDQAIVMAHVYGHADFFKNNLWFAATNRKMVDQMANHGTRIRRYADRHGTDRVERFLDDALAIENLVDPHEVYAPRPPAPPARDAADALEDEARTLEERVPRVRSGHEYMDRHLQPPEEREKERRRLSDELHRRRRFPPEPRRDVVGFLAEHAPLASWQQDVLSIVRTEALYFAPQAMTKVMNEGWATFWHSAILTERILRDDEVIDFADVHSGTVAQAPGRLNPYKLGLELWRDIEDRWNRAGSPAAGGGRRKIFEVRKAHNDVTFVDEFLTEEFAERRRMFTTRTGTDGTPRIASRDVREIRERVLGDLTNGGQPVVVVDDGNFRNRGELLLDHRFDGRDLRTDWARETLECLRRIWGRPVHLRTRVDGRPRLLTYDGDRHTSGDAPAAE